MRYHKGVRSLAKMVTISDYLGIIDGGTVELWRFPALDLSQHLSGDLVATELGAAWLPLW